ncbi:hypothetical protein RHMOL_Rhmol02G0202500 [Rhododendron molle]|uniref:Uncharacterized protein n=1 Tax=Rhododendron molle TaxID=49168 RepID=A0ACC0PTZ4_RHOML|nr:hypothetical protein RHMOL_Rhmol02G0202500 [Rhododendron molle]
MGRRNMVRVSIKDGSLAWKDTSDSPELAEKRQKVTHDFFPTKPLTPQLSEKDKTELSTAGRLKALQEKFGLTVHVAVQEFAPSFAMADGRVVSIGDSVKLELGLRGLALLNDMEKAGQALLRVSKKAKLVTAERSRYRDDLMIERDKVKSMKTGLKGAKARIAQLEKERDKASRREGLSGWL